eukprot:scaffold22439_cov16-Tisochrysis_lutea.AAC.1
MGADTGASCVCPKETEAPRKQRPQGNKGPQESTGPKRTKILILHGLMMLASVLVVCAGVTVATVTDKVVINNMLGLAVGVAATFVTALYQ